MNLVQLATARAEARGPVRVAVIGAGKFASMFLTQAPSSPGLVVTTVADLDVDGARSRLRSVGWDEDRIEATRFTEDGAEAARSDDVDVVVEATGHPVAGLAHAEAALASGKHVVMVNVEGDVLAGPALARRAKAAGLVYTLAYGDQPALIAEQVDWARASGFRVTAAGKGTKYRPHYHQSTPETVWEHMGTTPEAAKAAGMNAQMFNSFYDGTKSAIEMAAVANACGLGVPENGLSFPPCGVDDLPHILRSREKGGVLDRDGLVEVVASVERDGRPVFRDLRWGVYVVFEALSDYAAECFRQYGMVTDDTGRHASLYRPYHLIGLELGVSVLNAALRNEATGAATGFRGDVAAIAKRDLKAGETLDGEGGYTVWGRLMPAAASRAAQALPIGLAKDVTLVCDLPQGTVVTRKDVRMPDGDARFAAAMRLREETLGMAGNA